MGEKRVGQIDLKTGKPLEGEGFVAYVFPKRQNGFIDRWFAMAQQALAVLKMFTRVEDFRVLMALLEQLEFENLIIVNQASIARDLGMYRSNISSAIKRLLEAGVILKGPKFGTSCSYRLNPNFGWKGSAKNHVEALDEHRKERMKAAKITGVVKGGKHKGEKK